MQKKMAKNKAGFSLVEMLVVLGIIGILSSAGLISYQTSKSEANLRAAQREVAQVIRMAQSYALQGKTQYMGASLKERTPCGYGFEFMDENTYRVFYTYKHASADSTCKDDRQYPGPRETAHARAGDSQAGELQSFDLPTDVTMTSPSFKDTRFYFTIPFGDVFESDSTADFGGQIITLTYGSDTKRIEVNKRGDVEELD